MFLGAYHFDGSFEELLPAYERLAASYPPDSLDLHVCIERDGGLTVFDACPSSAVFAEGKKLFIVGWHDFSSSVKCAISDDWMPSNLT